MDILRLKNGFFIIFLWTFSENFLQTPRRQGSFTDFKNVLMFFFLIYMWNCYKHHCWMLNVFHFTNRTHDSVCITYIIQNGKQFARMSSPLAITVQNKSISSACASIYPDSMYSIIPNWCDYNNFFMFTKIVSWVSEFLNA